MLWMAVAGFLFAMNVVAAELVRRLAAERTRGRELILEAADKYADICNQLSEVATRREQLTAELELREIRFTGQLLWVKGSEGPASTDAAVAAFELGQHSVATGLEFAVDGGVILGVVHHDGAAWRAYARTSAPRSGGQGGVQWSAITGTVERARSEVERMLSEVQAFERGRGRRSAS